MNARGVGPASLLAFPERHGQPQTGIRGGTGSGNLGSRASG